MQRSRTSYLIGALVTILLCIVCVGGIIYPVAVQLTLPSARDALDRFAHMPPDRPDDLRVVRQALLQDVPIGTTKRTITAFIQQRGGTFDERGSIHCQDNNVRNDLPTLSCYFAPAPAKINFPCLTTYSVNFVMDTTQLLVDITIDDGSMCL